MSEESAERLRLAAEWLEDWATQREPYPIGRIFRADAALLRALIRWSPDSDNDRCPMCYREGRHDDDCPVRLAGLLADSILGDIPGDDDDVCHGCEHSRDRHDDADGCIECRCPEYVR